MIKKRQGEGMKKFTAILTAGIMMFSLIPAYAQGITVSTTEETITLTVDMGSYYAGKTIGYEVIRPTKGVGNVTDGASATLLSVFESFGESVADANGKATFTITPRTDAPAGYYNAVAGVKEKTIEISEKFPFAPKSAVDSLILSIEAPEATSDTIAALFVDPSDPEVLAGYEVLGLTEYPEYNMYKDDTYGGSAMRTMVHKVLCNDLKGKSYLKAQVGTAFQDAVYRSVMFTLKDASALVSFMENNATKVGLSNAKLYSTVYSKPEVFTADDKTALATKLAAHGWTGTETIQNIANVIDEYIFMTEVTSLTDGYGKIGTMIDLGMDVLTAHGAVLTNYETSVKEDVWRAVSSATTMTDFVTALNASIPANQQSGAGTGTNNGIIITPPSTPPTSSGGGGGGGGGFGGGSLKPSTAPSTPAAPTPGNTSNSIFSDIADVAWADEAITELYKEEIISGNGDGTFAPNNSMKRSEFLKILMLALELVDENAETDFNDVAKDSWYYTYVASAQKLGIANGYNNNFQPDATISREDAATMIFRCVAAAQKQLPELKEESAFADDSHIADYAKDAVSALYKAEIINGMSETEFSPKTNITRAQAAKMIYGLMNAVR